MLIVSTGPATLPCMHTVRAGAASMFDPSIPFTVASLADAIRERQLAAETLAAEVIRRCQLQQHLNALISQDPDALVAQARRADADLDAGRCRGALHGVPILIKDNIDTCGLPTSAGTPALEGQTPIRNAPSVQRLLDAGALLAGKGNLHELAVGGTSDNLHFGRVGNPYAPQLHPGGSSGGPAAAVAAHVWCRRAWARTPTGQFAGRARSRVLRAFGRRMAVIRMAV